MDINIGEILQNFVVATIIWVLMNQERKTILDRLAKLEDKHEKLIQQYQDDLRDWSGIDPRFNTWSNRKLEGDTKTREYMFAADERSKAEELMNK